MQKQTRKYKKTEFLFFPHKWHHSSQLTNIAIVIALVPTGKSPEIQFINLIRTYVCLLLITSHHTYYNYPRHNCHAEPPTRRTWQDNGRREAEEKSRNSNSTRVSFNFVTPWFLPWDRQDMEVHEDINQISCVRAKLLLLFWQIRMSI